MRTRTLRIPVTFATIALLATACSGTNATGGSGDGTGAGKPEVIRFAFAPDPVWQYLDDKGYIDRWEKKNNIKIETSDTWDKFTVFAGGHADIVSMGTDELPLMQEKTDAKVLAFGKYNHQRVPLYRRAQDPYKTLADVPKGSTICVSGPLSNTTVWSVIAYEKNGLNYRVGSGDFNLVVQDHFVMPKLLMKGECKVAAFIPEAAVTYLRTGKIKAMYDGRQPWQVYHDLCKCDHDGIMSNLFVTRKDWYSSHKKEAKAFLALWQEGINLWKKNKAEIIKSYPDLFSVKGKKDVQFLIKYMSGKNDWFVDSVYMDPQWIKEEKKFYQYMVDANWLKKGFSQPSWVSITP